MCRLDRSAWWLAGCRPARLSRRRLLEGAAGLAGGLALTHGFSATADAHQAEGGTGSASATPQASAAGVGQAQGGGRAIARWLGGGVLELATPDYGEVAYVDAWLWNNTGWSAFGRSLATEYATAASFDSYVREKAPRTVLAKPTTRPGWSRWSWATYSSQRWISRKETSSGSPFR